MRRFFERGKFRIYVSYINKTYLSSRPSRKELPSYLIRVNTLFCQNIPGLLLCCPKFKHQYISVIHFSLPPVSISLHYFSLYRNSAGSPGSYLQRRTAEDVHNVLWSSWYRYDPRPQL